jgi:hypothetical protein
MKTTKCLFLVLALCRILTLSQAFAQDDEMIFPEGDQNISSPGSASAPPVMIDQSDASDVSDVEEYDG